MPDGLTELTAMQSAYKALEPLEPDQRVRAISWLIGTLNVEAEIGPARSAMNGGALGGGDPAAGVTTLGKPKDFILSKKPHTNVERMACLAYYLTNARGKATFKSADLVALNTEAAGPKIANPARDFDNADRSSGYLVTAGAGSKQISPRGEALVEGLPDRAAVQQAMDEHPFKQRRKPTKKATGSDE